MSLRLDILATIVLFFICPQPTNAGYQEHKNPGCLINSTCNPQAGKKMLHWKQALKSRSTKQIQLALKQGFYPFDIWAIRPFISKEYQDSIIIYHSVNPTHYKKDIFMGKLFWTKALPINNFHKIKTQDSLFFSDFIIRHKKGKFIRYIAPKEESPTSLTNDEIIFTLGELGQTYELSINSQQQLRIVATTEDYHPPFSIECPDPLKAFKLPLPSSFPLSTKHYCQKVWNTQLKTYEAIRIEHF